nr:hypothetical protein [Tanacetum cinerariifolium]
MWPDQEKKIQKIDRIARSFLIQGLPNDIYSLIDSNKTAKDLWDALAKHMFGSEYGEQDRKAAILYEYETFKANEGELLLDTYIQYLQVINDLKKCGYSKDNYELNFKFLNNLQPEWKQYATMLRQNKNLLDINIDTLYNILKQNQGDVNDVMKSKKKAVVITSDPLALVAEQTKVSKRKEKVVVSSESEGSDDELKKIIALLATTFNQKNFYSKPTNNNLRTSSANKKQEYVKYDDKKEKKKVNEKKRDISKVKCYNCKKERHFARDCKKAKDHAWMESNSDSDQEINANMVFIAQIEKFLSDSEASSSSSDNKIAKTIHIIMPSKDKLYNGRKGIGFENSSYFCKAKDSRPTLYDERVIGLGYTSRFLTHSNEALEIKKFKRARDNKIEFAYDYGNLNASYVNEKINFLDDYFQKIINLDFEKIDSPFQQKNSLKPYVSTVILEKIIIDLEYEVVSLLKKEKENLEIIESLKSKGFESSENAISESKNQSENDCQVVEKGCDQVENSYVIAPGMFKLSVSQSVSPISVIKMSCASNSVESKLKRKRRKRTSSKQHDKQVNKDVLRADKDFVHFSDLDTLSSVRSPKPSGVIWMKKGSSNTVKADLSSINHSNLNKNVKRYSCKDLMLCNNSHRRDTRSAHAYNNARNAYCNSYDVDVNDLFIFDDIVQICLWIIDSGCLKHMAGNRALLTNFVEKFLGTVRFRNNDFGVIAGYGDVVIGSIMIKKVYYVEDLLTRDHSSNLYTVALNEIASNSLACLLAKASSSQSWLWHQRLSHLNFATINNLVKNNIVRDVIFSMTMMMLESSRQKGILKCLLDILKNLLHLELTTNELIMKSSTMNVETSNVEIPSQEEEVFHESSESFQEESSSSSLNEDVRYHFFKDHVEKGTIELYFVATEYQLVNLFTKSLPEARFKFLVEKLGMMSRET